MEQDGGVILSRRDNQARGLARYALAFVNDAWRDPDEAVFERVHRFHLDSVACAVAALGLRMRAPWVLREEAKGYEDPLGATCFGNMRRVAVEKAVAANCAAVRELDANGTNFGYRSDTKEGRGEFGHNDFYPVVVAAAQQVACEGRRALKAMICLDEIRGRLAEVFALREHAIDHVLHGAIASAAVYGALVGASESQIESAIGMVVAHYVPFRAIRAGEQLSDSKGASAALTTEMAILSVRRAMRGFVGPADIFRNPKALFCRFEPPAEPRCSPFDLHLATHGSQFAIMDMHLKLGLYEHQSAGAIQGLMDVLSKCDPFPQSDDEVRRIEIAIYEPAYSIIGDPAKRDPRNRQTADHSMVYIIATLLRKAIEQRQASWEALMLLPADYEESSIRHPVTRRLMDRIAFRHGGKTYDSLYPEGIPTSLTLSLTDGRRLESGLVLFPLGHARNTSSQLDSVWRAKVDRLAVLGGLSGDMLKSRFEGARMHSPEQVARWYALTDEADCFA